MKEAVKEKNTMGRKNRKRVILAVAFATLIFAGLGRPASPAAHPDFSGRWILDLKRCTLNPAVSRDLSAGFFQIDHRDSLFSVHREFTQGGSPDTLDFALKTDGREVEGNEDGMPTRSSLRWDGDSLVYLTIYKTPRGEARNTVIYRLLDGGKTFRAEESFHGPRLSYDNVWVFAKED
jgi:hypothetical protein